MSSLVKLKWRCGDFCRLRRRAGDGRDTGSEHGRKAVRYAWSGHPPRSKRKPGARLRRLLCRTGQGGKVGMPVAIAPLPFESSRGCWWGQKSQCTFCGTNQDAISHRPSAPKEPSRTW